jgi:hypothetical protein
MNFLAQNTRRVIFEIFNVLVRKAAGSCRFFYDIYWIMTAVPETLGLPTATPLRAER